MTTDDLRTRAEMVAKRVWPDRWDAARITYPHAALQHYRRGAFVQGALWHATQQPSRERIARAIAACHWERDTGDVEPWVDLTAAEQENVIENYGARDIADAVLALLTGDESDE